MAESKPASPPLRLVASPRRPTLAEVYREHVDFVVRVVRHLGIGAPQVEDVVHDVFLVVHRRLEDYDARGSMRSWLYGIARRVVQHHRRAWTRARRREERWPSPLERPGPELRVAHLEAVAWIEGFLGSLEEGQRMAFVLTELEGMSAPEIAEALGVKVNTVYSRLRLARRRFERALAARHRREGGNGG